MKKNKSLIERLNKIGPNIEPCGKPLIWHEGFNKIPKTFVSFDTFF